MSAKKRIVYVNGEFIPEDQAVISVFDRGFLMADSVYEVSAVINGKMLDNEAHLKRLARSLNELKMPAPSANIEAIQQRLIAENHLQEGSIYLQVTRGTADRNFVFSYDMTPSLILFTQARNLVNDPLALKGLRVMTQPDIRWLRRDIKTTQLLAQSLAKMTALGAGYDDAWMLDGDGYVTEGSSNNVAIIKGNELITRPANHEILNGITRRAMFATLADFGLTLVERKFTADEAKQADSALMTAAGSLVTPVVNIDGENIADGKPSELVVKLRQAYIDYVLTHLSSHSASHRN